MSVDILYRTFIAIIFSLTLSISYIIILLCLKRSREISIKNFFIVSISAVSLLGGIGLIYKTIFDAYQSNTKDMEPFYTILGGMALIWSSIESIIDLFKKKI